MYVAYTLVNREERNEATSKTTFPPARSETAISDKRHFSLLFKGISRGNV